MSKIVAVLGSSGIIGTHMMISVPPDIEPIFHRRKPCPELGYESLDLTNWDAAGKWLDARRPDVVINLAGENRPDVVERGKMDYENINQELPDFLVSWCRKRDAFLIQASSQAVFLDHPAGCVNCYGRQKGTAETYLTGERACIVRPTFVLGIRPFPAIGRENPAEAMLAGTQPNQVDNRFFSVSFAWDVADILWNLCRTRPTGQVIHIGNPERLNRYDLARRLNPQGNFNPVTQEHCEKAWGIAPRPLDTTYTDARYHTPLDKGLELLRWRYREREADTLPYRAQELAAFLRRPYREVFPELSVGFLPLHAEVTKDFRRANREPEGALLDWYRTTEAYLWELTAYHTDAGFNYAGMCTGIAETLKARDAKNVLCLGDGVGTLTIALKKAGLEPVYHDLLCSRTAAFADARMAMRFADPPEAQGNLTFHIGQPHPGTAFDAVTALDFLEHLPNVEEWVRAMHAGLKPGGLFFAQNAFGCGSGPDGAMPMHLACNDRYVTEWTPLMKRVGFEQIEQSNWYRKL